MGLDQTGKRRRPLSSIGLKERKLNDRGTTLVNKEGNVCPTEKE